MIRKVPPPCVFGTGQKVPAFKSSTCLNNSLNYKKSQVLLLNLTKQARYSLFFSQQPHLIEFHYGHFLDTQVLTWLLTVILIIKPVACRCK